MHSTVAGAGTGDSFKCPRCGSVNTKFCYYNNYNFSQPRFFCKGCRRYWTMGGVLRNVPVGGGGRKTKRSKQRSGDGKASSVTVATVRERKPNNSRNSTSESSVVAANISPETKPLTPTESESVPVTALFDQTLGPPILDHQSPGDLFSEIGGYGSLMMTSSSGEVVESQNWNRRHWVEATDGLKVPEMEYSLLSNGNGGGAAEDWGLLDESYWLNNNTDHQQVNYLF